MKHIRYGIIGFGGIAENRIAKEGFGLDTSRFEGNPYAELVSAWDPNVDRAVAARNLGIAWADSAEQLLDDSSIDAVIIASNNRTHAEWGLKALRAGKHIFIEKPAGVSEEEIQALIDEASARKLSFGVDHMMTKNAYNILARHIVKEGSLGDISSITLHMEFPFGTTPEEAMTWRCSDPKELGGPIGDVASHCFYMAEFLLDCTITSLQCVYTPKTLDIAVEDGAFLSFKTDRGVPGSIRVAFNQFRGSLAGTLQNLGYEVYGSNGYLESKAAMFQLSGHHDEPVTIHLRSMITETIEDLVPGRIENIYAAQIAEHAMSIQQGTPLSGKDALRNLRMVLLAHASAADAGKEKSV